MTVATCVCWSMNSETRIAYGSRVRRHGKSRVWRRYQIASARRNLLIGNATDESQTKLVLISVASVLICGVNEFIHARAYSRASGKASRFARGVWVRVRAERVDNFFCAEEQAERGGL